MNWITRHILLLSPILLALGLASCVTDSEPVPCHDDNATFLTLTITPASQIATRAEGIEVEADNTAENDVPEIEKLSTLRIIILDESNKVEINKYFGYLTGESFTAIFPVKSDNKKSIYAIGNPESIEAGAGNGFKFDSWTEGTDISADLNDIAFTFDDSKFIPFYGMSTVDMSGVKPGERVETDIKLIRIATKFEVSIINNRSEDVQVSAFSIDKLASRQYLVPHFNRTVGDITKGGVISKTGNHEFVFSTNKVNDDFDWIESDSNPLLHWSEWLALAVAESHLDETDDAIADKRGWIMEYDSPETEDQHTQRVWNDIAATPSKITKTAKVTLPVHYYAESRYGIFTTEATDNKNDHINKDGVVMNAKKWIHDDAKGKQQSYDFHITFQSLNEDGSVKEGSDKTFDLDFYNVRALFRNTHVKVEITISDDEKKPIDWHIYTRDWNQRIQPEIVM